MPVRLHLCALALACSGAALLPPAPILAAPIGIDFGASAGEDFLEGGGGFAPAPRAEPRPRTGVSRSRPVYENHRAGPHATHRSMTVVHSRPRSTYIRGTGVFANANPGGSVIYVHSGGAAPSFGPPGPRIIDVEAERLDRASIGPSGVSVTRVGSAKIIRLAPSYSGARARDMGSLSAPQAPIAFPAPALPYEVEPPVDAPPPGVGFLEPWSDAWRQDCEARHASFDAALGTYLDADGWRRFCTGEAG